MDLSVVKNYLRIDYDYDDDFLQLAIDAALNYLESAIDDFNKKIRKKACKSKADIICLALIQDMYDQRVLMSKDDNVSYAIRSMMLQLQLM